MKIGDLIQLNEAGELIYDRRDHDPTVLIVGVDENSPMGKAWIVLVGERPDGKIPFSYQKYWEVVS